MYFDFASNFGISSMVIARGGTGSGSSSMVWGFGQVAKARSRLGDALRTRECCRSGEGGAKKNFLRRFRGGSRGGRRSLRAATTGEKCQLACNPSVRVLVGGAPDRFLPSSSGLDVTSRRASIERRGRRFRARAARVCASRPAPSSATRRARSPVASPADDVSIRCPSPRSPRASPPPPR